MKGENPNWGIITTVIVLSILATIILGVAMVSNDGGRDNSDHNDGNRLTSDRIDHSIFRGLTPVQIANRVGNFMEGARVAEDRIVSDLPFEKEFVYTYDSGGELRLRAVYFDMEPYEFYVSIDINAIGRENGINGISNAANATIDALDRFLQNFDCEIGDDYVLNIEGINENWNGWEVEVTQIYRKTVLENPGVKAIVDYDTGQVTHIWVWNWLFMDEIDQPYSSWEHSRDDALDGLIRINYTTEIPMDGRPVPNYHMSWSEFVNEPVDETRMDHMGYASVMGRFCMVLGINYWVEGNFSQSYYLEGDFSTPLTIWINDTITCTHKWYFDTETGKLLLWTLSDEYVSTEQRFYENLGSGNTTWDDYMLDTYPHYIK